MRPGGINTDPDVKDLREPSPNRIVTKNITDSRPLLRIVRHAVHRRCTGEGGGDGVQLGSLVPGPGPEEICIRFLQLTKAILTEREGKAGWESAVSRIRSLSSAIDFSIVAMRLNDLRHGTKPAEDVMLK